ncbi:flagellar filament capping protein FliD [Pseudoxanthomonas dokdonensis]|uniref:Flagellar hook-associated protein 2 n=1 Tax=Pseudoxanthomonas dokdonensis TaxID=344882 RepID=A0A0R0CY64_9GAMM|nr:flagellar filament capping protein FliD [Pseudoxanthomonas dokdonensis]KRG71079.1 flagellar hook protein FliD [Pseudoxanthomonas dokdonensis]
MADYSLGYGGIGSGLDITGMVEQLVAADRAPADNRLNRVENAAKFKISALGTVSSAFNNLQTALKAMTGADAFDARSVKSSTDTTLTATAGKSTPTGTYNIEVLSLATANKWLADSPVATSQTFAAGKLSVQVGDTTLDVDVPAGATLADIRSAINQAGAGKGVQASIVSANEGQFLSLSADKTGADNSVSLAFAEGGSDLQDLVASMQERVQAKDARVSIDGLEITASNNTLTDAVPGLSLVLKSEGSSTVTVSGDVAASRKLVQDFVTAYNAALAAIGTATAYDAENDAPSALTGDAQMRGASGQLRGMLGNLLGDLAAQGLDAKTLGLQTKGYPSSDGSLVLDTAKFDAAMAKDPDRIRAAFTGDSGFANTLLDTVKGYIGTDGAFTRRTATLNLQVKDVATQRTALDARMEAVGNRYKAQFVALDSMISQMNSTSSYLSQQLASLAAQI